jgi:hypothetical protein
MRAITILLLALIAFPLHVQADKKAAGLREMCEESYDYCIGFIDGVLSESERRKDLEGQLCLPVPLTYQQMFEAFTGHYDADPTGLAERPAAETVLAALLERYRCGQ